MFKVKSSDYIVQYCAKVMQTNFDEFRALLSRNFGKHCFVARSLCFSLSLDNNKHCFIVSFACSFMFRFSLDKNRHCFIVSFTCSLCFVFRSIKLEKCINVTLRTVTTNIVL